MAEISSQEALGRLNALAQGGTSALGMYDTVVQNQQQLSQNALAGAMAQTGVGGPRPGEAAELQKIVGDITRPYAESARTARNLAGAQVGYDATATDVYLRDVQERLDEERRQGKSKLDQANEQLRQELDYDNRRFQADMESRNRQLEYMKEQKRLEDEARASDPFYGLSASEKTALIEGIAMERQRRTAEKVAQLPDQSQAKSQAAADINAYAGKFEDDVNAYMARTGAGKMDARKAVEYLYAVGQNTQGPRRGGDRAPAPAGGGIQQALGNLLAAQWGDRAAQWRQNLAALGVDERTGEDYRYGTAIDMGVNPLIALGQYGGQGQERIGKFQETQRDAIAELLDQSLEGRGIYSGGPEAELVRSGLDPESIGDLVNRGIGPKDVAAISAGLDEVTITPTSEGAPDSIKGLVEQAISEGRSFNDALRDIDDALAEQELSLADEEVAVLRAFYEPRFKLRR